MIKTLRHCCHNCQYLGITINNEFEWECYCEANEEPDYAENCINPRDCPKFAINTEKDNLIFDEEKDNE